MLQFRPLIWGDSRDTVGVWLLHGYSLSGSTPGFTNDVLETESWRYNSCIWCREKTIATVILYLILSFGGLAQWYSAGLWAGWSVVRFPAGAGNFSLHHRVQTGSGAHPASYPVGTSGSFPGVKWPGREDDHWPLPRTEVENVWSYTSTTPIRLHGVVVS
jgi:hypothetical protein